MRLWEEEGEKGWCVGGGGEKGYVGRGGGEGVWVEGGGGGSSWECPDTLHTFILCTLDIHSNTPSNAP